MDYIVPCDSAFLERRDWDRCKAERFFVKGVCLVQRARWYEEVDVSEASDHDLKYAIINLTNRLVKAMSWCTRRRCIYTNAPHLPR